METHPADYRLERWIALFLALLFFVPFVAKAEESPLALVCSGNNAWLQHASNDAPASAWILEDARLSAGTIAKASCSEVPVPAPAKIAFNGRMATLDYRCGDADEDGLVDCVLELDGQPLAKRVAFEGEPLKVLVSFAGDLDRDGQLDLLVDVARNAYEYRPALYLSSPGAGGLQMVARR
ncbi:MAG: hypothetical protein M3Q69_06435 [Acidobacteriota bacterium]|nr:hypothetical protein [Acidobacteriota bacterium]